MHILRSVHGGPNSTMVTYILFVSMKRSPASIINGVGLSAAAEVLLRGSSLQLKCCWGPRVNLLLLNEGDVLTL